MAVLWLALCLILPSTLMAQPAPESPQPVVHALGAAELFRPLDMLASNAVQRVAAAIQTEQLSAAPRRILLVETLPDSNANAVLQEFAAERLNAELGKDRRFSLIRRKDTHASFPASAWFFGALTWEYLEPLGLEHRAELVMQIRARLRGRIIYLWLAVYDVQSRKTIYLDELAAASAPGMSELMASTGDVDAASQYRLRPAGAVPANAAGFAPYPGGPGPPGLFVFLDDGRLVLYRIDNGHFTPVVESYIRANRRVYQRFRERQVNMTCVPGSGGGPGKLLLGDAHESLEMEVTGTSIGPPKDRGPRGTPIAELDGDPVFAQMENSNYAFRNLVLHGVRVVNLGALFPSPFIQAAVGPVRRPGLNEWVFLTLGRQLRVQNPRGEVVWQSDQRHGFGLVTADLDRDGMAEIIATSGDAPADTDRLTIYEWNGSTFTQAWSQGLTRPVRQLAAIRDNRGGGVLVITGAPGDTVHQVLRLDAAWRK
ncbi:MAG: hypothetical protein GMKNLPBB_00316 [Myxococcota bacterium]|nr:hypothetical protein [Myxococcota bacterium]